MPLLEQPIFFRLINYSNHFITVAKLIRMHWFLTDFLIF